MNKTVGVAIFAIGLAIAATIAFLFTRKAEPFTIGLISTATGNYAANGGECRRGFHLALEEVNKQGGIQGRPIVSVDLEDEGNPEKSLKVMEEFRQKNIHYIIGPFLSSAAQKIVPFANEHHMVVVGPVIATNTLTGFDDYFFRLFPSITIIGEKTGALVWAENHRNIAVIYDTRNGEFGESFLAGFKTAFQNQMKTSVEVYPITPNTEHFSFKQLGVQILQTKPSAIVMSLSPNHAAVLSQRLRELAPTVALYTSPWALSQDLLEGGSKAVVGLKGFVPFDANSQNPKFLAFKNTFVFRFGAQPTYCSTLFYDATAMLLNTIKTTPNPTPERIKKTLSGMPFGGVQGEYSFDAFGDTQKELTLYEVTDHGLHPAQQTEPHP